MAAFYDETFPSSRSGQLTSVIDNYYDSPCSLGWDSLEDLEGLFSLRTLEK